MGDRCYMYMTVRRDQTKDAKWVEGLESWGMGLQDGGEIQDDQADCGCFEERQALSLRGLVFHGYHTEGDNYPAAYFCSDGLQMVEHYGTGVGLSISYDISDPARPTLDPASLTEAQVFLNTYAKVVAIVAASWDTPLQEKNDD